MKKLISLLLILFFIGCTTIPMTIEKRLKAHAVEYFPYCPPFEVLFDRVETIAFICDTGQTVTFSSYERHAVTMGGREKYTETIIEALEMFNKTLANVDLVIHNHFVNKKFSDSDKYFYFELRQNGFRGTFAIYFVPTKKITGINDNE